jgi:hypothetical protein
MSTTNPPSVLLLKVREVVARLAGARNACGKLRLGDEFDRANVEISRLQDELDELEAAVPSPPRSHDDLVVLAEIVHGDAEVDSDGRLVELDEPAAARLVEAVLQFDNRLEAELKEARERVHKLTDAIEAIAMMRTAEPDSPLAAEMRRIATDTLSVRQQKDHEQAWKACQQK